jgi:hypothetical protein
MTYPHDGCCLPCHFARERSETSYRSNCSQNTPAASRRPTASRLVFRIVTTYPDPPPQFPAYIRISCLPTIRQNGKYHVVMDPGGGGVRERERESFCTHTPKEQHHGYMREGRSTVWIRNQRCRARKWPSPPIRRSPAVDVNGVTVCMSKITSLSPPPSSTTPCPPLSCLLRSLLFASLPWLERAVDIRKRPQRIVTGPPPKP